jgi:hypothetical protein
MERLFPRALNGSSGPDGGDRHNETVMPFWATPGRHRGETPNPVSYGSVLGIRDIRRRGFRLQQDRIGPVMPLYGGAHTATAGQNLSQG